MWKSISSVLGPAWLIAILLWIIFILFLFIAMESLPTYKMNSYYYLLSALSQGLAAVAAIVFAISLAVAQLLGRYTQKAVPRIYSKATMLYLVFFLTAIIFPLVALTEVSFLRVQVSLTLGAGCLFLLIPYFWSFRKKLDPENMLKDLGARSIKETVRSHVPSDVKIMGDIAVAACINRDLDILDEAVVQLCSVATHSRDEELLKNIFARIVNAANAGLDNYLAYHIVLAELDKCGGAAARPETEALFRMVGRSLRDMGNEAAEYGKEWATNLVALALRMLGASAERSDYPRGSHLMGLMLRDVGWKAIDKRLADATVSAAANLGRLGMDVTLRTGDYPLDWISFGLYQIGEIANKKAVAQGAKESLAWLLLIGAHQVKSSGRQRDSVLGHLSDLKKIVTRELVEEASELASAYLLLEYATLFDRLNDTISVLKQDC